MFLPDNVTVNIILTGLRDGIRRGYELGRRIKSERRAKYFYRFRDYKSEQPRQIDERARYITGLKE